MSVNKLTEGSILRSLITLSLPIVFANILHTAYNLIDTFWVGRLGENAIAAVSLSFPIIFLIISLGGGLAIAGSIFIAQYKGKGDNDKIDKVSMQTFILIIFVSLILSIVGYFSAEYLLQLMGAENNVIMNATIYLKVSFLGMLFVFIFFMFQSVLRGIGVVKLPMYVVSATVILNAILDPILINGWGVIPAYGVAGAAIATLFSQAVAAMISLYYLFRGKFGIHLKIKDIKPDWKIIKDLFKLGIPASLEQSTRAFGFALMTVLVVRFGTSSIAAYGIGTRILSFVVIPAIGLSMAASTLVGQNIGAKKIKRAEDIAIQSTIISFVILSLAGVLIYFFAHELSEFFIPGELEAIKESTNLIRIMALSFGFIGVYQVLSGTLRGAGDTFMAMIFTFISLWVLQFPIAYILSRYFLNEEGIWWSFPLSNIISTFGLIIYFMKGTWKKKKITDEEKNIIKVSEETLVEEGLN